MWRYFTTFAVLLRRRATDPKSESWADLLTPFACDRKLYSFFLVSPQTSVLLRVLGKLKVVATGAHGRLPPYRFINNPNSRAKHTNVPNNRNVADCCVLLYVIVYAKPVVIQL